MRARTLIEFKMLVNSTVNSKTTEPYYSILRQFPDFILIKKNGDVTTWIFNGKIHQLKLLQQKVIKTEI
jgi:hypothetical protein